MSGNYRNFAHNGTSFASWAFAVCALGLFAVQSQSLAGQGETDTATTSPDATSIDRPSARATTPIVIAPLIANRVDGQTGALIATFTADSYEQLRAARLVEMALPLSATRGVVADLRRVEIMPEGARAQIVNGQDVRWSELRVAAFSGRVRAVGDSYVFIAITPNQVAGYIVLDGATYLISSGDPAARNYEVTIADARSFPASIAGANGLIPLCSLDDAVASATKSNSDGHDSSGGSARGASLHVQVADIYIECQHDYTALFATGEDAADYAAILFAVASDIYRRDTGAEIRIPDGYIRVWETADEPWGAINDWGDLGAFSGYWQQNMNDVERTLVHLLTYPVFGGVASSIGGLCSHTDGYALSSVFGFFPTPVQHTHDDNWDLIVVPHELGHNFGSHHTFYCGPDDKGYCPPIECVEDENQPDAGTIMSYCHLNNGGISNVGIRLHPLVQATIRNYMTTAPCMEIIEFEPGDYDHNGVLDEADLLSAAMCIYLPFDAAGCYETFELDGDGELTPCDYDVLYEMIHPDEPPPDCNDNGVADGCGDIAGGFSIDCNLNMIPDECELLIDCNGNGEMDECDINSGVSSDHNVNGIPDECEPADRTVYVDDDGPFDPAPGDPNTGDPDEDGTAEHPYDSIQEAIDDADGFLQIIEVVVADGVYTGAQNRSISFGGREILVASANGPDQCTIDCQGLGRAFEFNSLETSASRVEGFTIINGAADNGAAIRCQENSSPSISNCVISGHVAEEFGGAVYVLESNPSISRCTFENNSAGTSGGAIYYNDSESVITHSTFAGNSASSGGAIYLRSDSVITLHNCQLTGNEASGSGGAIYQQSSVLTATNSTIANNTAASSGGAIHSVLSVAFTRGGILWGNQADDGPEVRLVAASSMTVDYSNVAGGQDGVSVDGTSALAWGDGNLDSDPLFADPDMGDFHLTFGSPAIDGGDPLFEPLPNESDLDGDDRVLNERLDIGADEYVPGSEPPCEGDTNGDGVVDPLDTGFVLSRFGCAVNTGDPTCDAADPNGDGVVDPLDVGYVLSRFGACP